MKICFVVNEGILYCASILFLSVQEVSINMMTTEKNCTLVERLKLMCIGVHHDDFFVRTLEYQWLFKSSSSLSIFYRTPFLRELIWTIRRPQFCLTGTFLWYLRSGMDFSSIFSYWVSRTVFYFFFRLPFANSPYDGRMYNFIYIKYSSSFSWIYFSVEINVE